MEGVRTYLGYLLLVVTIFGCEENAPDAGQCLLERIQFDAYNELRFTTISGGQMYQLQQVLTLEDEPKTIASFQFDFYKDSLSVRDLLENPTEPYLTVCFAPGRLPKRVVRYFPGSGVRLIHELTYVSDYQLLIDLYRISSSDDTLHVAYGTYSFDDRGNVIHLESYSIDPSNRDLFIKLEDRVMTYDTYANPVKGLFLPFFAVTNLPDVKFFSTNNLLTIEENEQVAHYNYRYGRDVPVVEFPPIGGKIQFGYLNCE